MAKFKYIFTFFTVLCITILFSANSNAQLIENGGFETGDFTGWTVVEMVPNGGDWFVYSGTETPISNFTVLPPPVGTYAALTDQGDPSSQVLFQDINVPSNGDTECSLIYYYINRATVGFFNGPDLSHLGSENQQARIDIMDPNAPDFDIGAGVLDNLFQTEPGDPLEVGYTTLNFDLSDYAGTTVRLRIAEVDNLGEFNFAVDAVDCEGGQATAQVPTLSEWGMIAMAGILGIVGFMVARRRKAVA